MRTEQEYRNIKAENARLTAEVERLKQELDEALLIHQTDTGTESVVATLQARIDELEAERTWQPIDEETPQNEVVLLLGRNGVCAGEWGDYFRYNQPKFTHWMPLPQSPEGKL